MKRYIYLLGTLSLLLTSFSYAQNKLDIEAIKQQAQASANEFTELRAMLRDDNEDIRLATFDAMAAHGDPSLYELATSTAIVDVNLKWSSFFRHFFMRRPLSLYIVEPELYNKELSVIALCYKTQQCID